MVKYTYESWLALQQRLRHRLDGKQRWLNVVKSDAELLELSGSTIKIIRHQAQDILSQLNAEHRTPSVPAKKTRGKKQQKAGSPNSASLISHLFEAYEATEDTLTKCAIVYLIKDGCKIPETKELPEKFAHRIHRQQKEIKQLEEQVTARLSKGRDLTGKNFWRP